MHCMLVLLCLTVLCVVKPYKKYHINVMEGLIILSLFSTTLAIYDRDNDLYVGSTVATVSIFFPFAYGVVFILYRITRILHRKFWSVLKYYIAFSLKFLPLSTVLGIAESDAMLIALRWLMIILCPLHTIVCHQYCSLQVECKLQTPLSELSLW